MRTKKTSSDHVLMPAGIYVRNAGKVHEICPECKGELYGASDCQTCHGDGAVVVLCANCGESLTRGEDDDVDWCRVCREELPTEYEIYLCRVHAAPTAIR